MVNWGQWISFGMLLDLNNRYNQGQIIDKNELHAVIESCKNAHDRDVENNSVLPTDQKEERKRLFSKIADAVKDYIEQLLRDEGRLRE